MQSQWVESELEALVDGDTSDWREDSPSGDAKELPLSQAVSQNYKKPLVLKLTFTRGWFDGSSFFASISVHSASAAPSNA